MDERGQKIQTANYQINKFWGFNVQPVDYSELYGIVYLQVAKQVNLKSSHHKNLKPCEVMDVNKSYCGKYTKLLYCTPSINTVLHVNYNSNS